jgi:hypothetical protein
LIPATLDCEGAKRWLGQVGDSLVVDRVATAAGVITDKLRRYDGRGGAKAEDALFAEHTWLTDQVRSENVEALVPVKLWETQLANETSRAEHRLGKLIHKGAPFYNCGVCCFLGDDFQRAYGFIAEGAKEDARTHGATAAPLFTGNHALSRQVLIDPLVKTVLPLFAVDYLQIAGRTLDAAELSDLLLWMSQRETDAMQVLLALHDRRKLDRLPNNKSGQLNRLEVVRRLHLVIESVMRERNLGAGELFKRMELAFATNPIAAAAFKSLHDWHIDPTRASIRHTATGLNSVVNEAISRLGVAVSRDERAGIAAYTNVRIRNSVQHLNEENADVFTQAAMADKMSAWALASCRNVRHILDGTW